MTQNDQILAALKQGKTISPLSALREFGCMRLAARIYDLKQDGHEINAVKRKNSNASWVEYEMAQDPASPAPSHNYQTDWRSV
jgi:hypothetical protein